MNTKATELIFEQQEEARRRIPAVVSGELQIGVQEVVRAGNQFSDIDVDFKGKISERAYDFLINWLVKNKNNLTT